MGGGWFGKHQSRIIRGMISAASMIASRDVCEMVQSLMEVMRRLPAKQGQGLLEKMPLMVCVRNILQSCNNDSSLTRLWGRRMADLALQLERHELRYSHLGGQPAVPNTQIFSRC